MARIGVLGISGGRGHAHARRTAFIQSKQDSGPSGGGRAARRSWWPARAHRAKPVHVIATEAAMGGAPTMRLFHKITGTPVLFADVRR
jgi:hypothetical protein